MALHSLMLRYVSFSSGRTQVSESLDHSARRSVHTLAFAPHGAFSSDAIDPSFSLRPPSVTNSAPSLVHHVLVIRDQSGAHAHDLHQEFYTIGRSKHAAIHISGATVSRIHAALYRVAGIEGQPCYRLLDGHPETQQASTNGSYVNGIRVSDQYLKHCDRVAFGTDVTGQFFRVDPNLPPHPDFALECRLNPALLAWANNHGIDLTTTGPGQPPPVAPPPSPFLSLGVDGEAQTHGQIASWEPMGSGTPPEEPVDTGHLVEPSYTKLGQILVRKGLITQEQLETALTAQDDQHIPLGQYLVEEGLVSQKAMDEAVQNQQMRLGEILLRRQWISVDQLRSALQRQHENPHRRLGELLIEQGLLTLPQLEAAIQEQHWRRNGFWFLQ